MCALPHIFVGPLEWAHCPWFTWVGRSLFFSHSIHTETESTACHAFKQIAPDKSQPGRPLTGNPFPSLCSRLHCTSNFECCAFMIIHTDTLSFAFQDLGWTNLNMWQIELPPQRLPPLEHVGRVKCFP
jgi:hypothetical protein